MRQRKQSFRKKRRPLRKNDLLLVLMVTVTLVLLVLIWSGSHLGGLVVLAVTIVLTALILTVSGSSELLPATLRAMLGEIRRILRG